MPATNRPLQGPPLATRPPGPSLPLPLRARKLPKRYTPVVFALYMSAIMAFFMSSVIIGVNTGIGAGYARRVFDTYLLAMPVAFCCVMLVRPVVARLVAATVHNG